MGIALAAMISSAKALPTAEITFGTLILQRGESGYLPVYVTASSPTLLYFFDFTLKATGSALSFDDSPSPASDPTFADLHYVFYGNSQDEYFDSPLGYAYTPSEFRAYDTADNSTPGPMDTTSRLLGMVPVTASESLTGTVTITLDDAQFLIWDAFMSSLPYTSTPGTITVVPEPSAMALLAVGLIGILLWGRVRAWV